MFSVKMFVASLKVENLFRIPRTDLSENNKPFKGFLNQL